LAEPERQVYLNGSWVPLSEARVSILDHGFLYGDGVFEGIRSYMGRPFRLDDHVRRLFESAHSIRLDIGLKPEEVSAAVLEALRLNRLEDAYIRVQVSRGTGDLGLDPRSSKRATVFVLADRISLYPASLYDEGLRALTVSIRRTSVDSLSPRVKSLNYLNNILAKEQATTSGYAEAILLGPEGFPIEATGENLFVVRRGELWTPPLYLGILDGITRRTILELAAEPSMGLTVREMPFTLHDLYVAEECFLTGTAAEIVPVAEVDGRRIGAGSPGPVTGRLRSRFASYVRDIVRVS
jgi:branched-chain amino acid aminotransferase